MPRAIIAQLGVAFHWQPSEIRALALDDALAFIDEALKMGVLEKA